MRPRLPRISSHIQRMSKVDYDTSNMDWKRTKGLSEDPISSKAFQVQMRLWKLRSLANVFRCLNLANWANSWFGPGSRSQRWGRSWHWVVLPGRGVYTNTEGKIQQNEFHTFLLSSFLLGTGPLWYLSSTLSTVLWKLILGAWTHCRSPQRGNLQGLGRLHSSVQGVSIIASSFWRIPTQRTGKTLQLT